MYEKNFSSLNAWEVIFGENISEYCCLLSLLVATTATVIVTVHCDNASCFYHIAEFLLKFGALGSHLP